jgi:sporulation protein YlmC with PRC-barrel domain
MWTTYRSLLGRAVVDASGKLVGSVADLRAENVGGRLRVTALLVGKGRLLAILGLPMAELIGGGIVHGYLVPWQDVASIDGEIRLRVLKDRLGRLPDVSRRG